MKLQNKFQKLYIVIVICIVNFNHLAISQADVISAMGSHIEVEDKTCFKVLSHSNRLEQYNVYYFDGNIKTQYTFLVLDDSSVLYHGNRIDYYSSGQPQRLSNYFEGALIGDYLDFYESGKLTSHFFFLPDTSKNISEIKIIGKIFSAYNNQAVGTSHSFEKSMKYLPHGVWKEYYENGQLKSIKKYNRGLEEGVWLYYYSDGKKKMEGGFIEESIVIPKEISYSVKCDECDFLMSNEYYPFFRKKKEEWKCWDKNGNPVNCEDLYR